MAFSDSKEELSREQKTERNKTRRKREPQSKRIKRNLSKARRTYSAQA